MATRKEIWDALDVIEGKKKGSTYKNLEKEKVRQGYKKKKTVKKRTAKKRK
jgi:hypothetical protein